MPDFSRERDHGGRVAGVDEVGRGPLAGPVVACAVVFTQGVPDAVARLLDDSKKLSARARAAAYAALNGAPGVEIGVAAASVPEIDTHNILHASHIAMRRAVWRLPAMPDLALIDGNLVPPGLGCEARPVIGGDALSFSIAAASIIAKIVRDRLMERLAARWGMYGWARNAGYPTAAHRAAMTEHGVTRHHRKSFAPVRDCLVLRSGAARPHPSRAASEVV